jgi:hypothetical protein
MTKSDHELGDLLRETFADKEHQVDHLPEATKASAARSGAASHGAWGSGNRRLTPVLAGAAAVVIVLGGAFVVRQNLPQPTSFPAPAATTSTPSIGPDGIALTDDIRIWAAAVKGMVEREPGAPAYTVVNAPQENEGAVRGEPFTDAEKIAITGLVAPTKLRWIHERPAKADPCAPDAGGPYVTVGAIVRRADHVEVDASIWRGCLSGRWLTFRLAQQAGDWTVTGTVGPEAVS